MEWWDKMMFPMQRVWIRVTTRFGARKSGILKLSKDVMSCEYEDVHVMWEMLTRNKTQETPTKRKKKPIWNIFHWAMRTPYLCCSF